MNATITAASPEQLRARLELRRSGAAGMHKDRRTRRNRDRASQRRNAISDSRKGF